MEIDPGTVVANRYRISRPLGRGGMGEVFAAENIRTGRPVAVKLLRSDSKTKSSAVARFRREARAAGSINSDHVTQVLDVEEDAEHGIVLVFELLEGESLIDRLKRTGPIPFDELHPIIDQVWMGLADAHRAGIIHRDLKPSNVFLERRPDGTIRVKILDFGISKLPKEMGGETLTEMGQSLGTFSFMPPEQIGKAKTVDHRADIYASATLIYQALSGQLPYTARNILVMVEMKTKSEARKLADAMGAGVDPRLEDFLSKCLSRDASQRFQTALDALNAWRELRPSGPPQGQTSSSGSYAAVTPLPSSGGMQSPQSQVSHASHASQQSHSSQASQASPLPAAMVPRGVEQLVRAAPSSVAIETKPDILNDPTTTDTTGATLAMPLSQLARTDPIPMVRQAGQPQMGMSGTMVVNQDGGGGQRQNASPSPQQGYEAQRQADNASLQSALQQGPPNYFAPQQTAAISLMHAQQRAIAQVPRLVDDPTSGPSSGDQTRVYRPDRGAGQESSSLNLTPPAATSERKGSSVPLVFGAILFALVGFAVVALLLQYFHIH